MRRSTLAVWAAQPSRLREDANAEEDARRALGDRVLVELVQNAVDACPGAVRLELVDGALRVLDRGAGLTQEGLQALCSLRASAKASGIGMFGTGFASVLALSDTPELHGPTGSVGFSEARTAEAVADLGLTAEHLPVLRLPWDVPAREVPEGWSTMVHLPLREGAVVPAVERVLPLLLPGLEHLDAFGEVIEAVASDGGLLCDGVVWDLATLPVHLDAAAVESLPVERRGRPAGHVRVLAPRVGWPAGVARVLHAPQPTDTELSLPLLVSAPVPVAPDRRRVEGGPVTQACLAAAAQAAYDLCVRLAGDRGVLDLVPVGLGASAVDGVLRSELLALLEAAPPVRGAVLDVGDATPAVHELERPRVDDLLPVTWPVRHPALDVLGVRRLATSDVIELLRDTVTSPAGWREVYDALADAPDRDALGALPVPLADGRTVTGARGAWLPGPGVDALVAAGVALRVVHPDAAHPLLERLGAGVPEAGLVLDDPAVREAVENEESDELAEAVLDLVAAAGRGRPWLAALVLPGGECAGDCVLPGSPMLGLLEEDLPVVPDDVVERWGAEALQHCGVVWLPRVVHAEEAEQVDLADEWMAQTPMADDPTFVTHLDVLRWPESLDLLRSEQALWEAVVTPVLTLDGDRADSYAAWWLREEAGVEVP